MLVEGLLESAADCLTVSSEPAGDTLLQQFNMHFETMTADTPELLPLAQRIRYQVYCVENHLENPADHPDALECDEFDAHAVQSLLVHRRTQAALGTVRLVLPLPHAPQESFAIQRLSNHPALRGSRALPLRSTAEVSRFSISRKFGRCVTDMKTKRDPFETALACETRVRPSSPLMRLGLIQALVRMSVDNGITHWCAVMEPTLLRMLAAMAVHFEPIGSLVEYHGWRQPCFCNVADVLCCVKRERPAFWDVLTLGGALLADHDLRRRA